MSADAIFTKENIDRYLKEVGKKFRKLNGTEIPAEIILIGGASILINYGFRASTTDVDALIHASSAMKDAINDVTDALGLPNNWLNEDFKHTSSYTPRLVNYTRYYRTFSNILTVRTVTGEYLIAMKLKAGRRYKHDISDIVGILRAQSHAGNPLDFAQIDQAVQDLYDGWENLPEHSLEIINGILAETDLDALYEEYTRNESAAKQELISFEKDYPNVLREDNLADVLKQLQRKKSI